MSETSWDDWLGAHHEIMVRSAPCERCGVDTHGFPIRAGDPLLCAKCEIHLFKTGVKVRDWQSWGDNPEKCDNCPSRGATRYPAFKVWVYLCDHCNSLNVDCKDIIWYRELEESICNS